MILEVQAYTIDCSNTDTSVIVKDDTGPWCRREEVDAKVNELLDEQTRFWIDMSNELISEAREDALLSARIKASIVLFASLIVATIPLLLYGVAGVLGLIQ